MLRGHVDILLAVDHIYQAGDFAMKKIHILGALAIGLMGFTTLAQAETVVAPAATAPDHIGEAANKRVAKMTEQLGLRIDQQVKLRTIYAQWQADVSKIRPAPWGSGKGFEAPQFRKLAEANKVKIDSVLTPEQRAKLAAIREEAHKKAASRLDRGNHRIPVNGGLMGPRTL